MAFNLGGLLGGIGGVLGPVLNFLGTEQANKQNMLMNTGEWKAQQIGTEAKMLGVSPLALLGQNFQPTPAQNVFGGMDSSLGQNLGRALASGGDSDAEQRMDALREQNLQLQNANLANDYVGGQLRNTAARLRLQPSTPPVRHFPSGEEFGPWWPSNVERPKPGLQAVMGADGRQYFIPSAAVQQGLWSPLPGLPANPQAAADVVRANAAGMPPDVARMSGLPPGAYPFVPGTAPSLWDRWFGN